MLAGELDHELGEDVDHDVVTTRERVLEEAHPLLHGEERRLVLRVLDDSDDDAIEDRRRALDDVDVPVRDGVVATWADRSDHRARYTVIRAEP